MSKSAKPSTAKIVISADTQIGNTSAEADDKFLFQCFVDHPALASVKDQESPKMFLLGRTGSGKTAIIRMLEKQEEVVSDVDLRTISMDYISNSDILQFLSELDVDLDLFFQTLWKHVLCIEYIRLRFDVEDETKSRWAFQNIWATFGSDKTKRTALDYLKKFQNEFWVTMDESMREVTKTFEDKISADAEIGSHLAKYSAKAGYVNSLGTQVKKFIVQRAKKIINSDLLANLNKVLNLLAEYETHHKRKYYIVIDKLDDDWVDSSVRFSLIRALIESLKTFRRIRNLKVIVAIRSDVLERVVLEESSLGFQREKFEDYMLQLRWDADQLRELVQKRINFLYRSQYTTEDVYFEDIFPEKVASERSLDYILNRTLMRPRDVIAFINQCFIEAQNEPKIVRKHILAAEGEYSRKRRDTLEFEWRSTLPSLPPVLNSFIGRSPRFPFTDLLDEEKMLELAITVGSQNKIEYDAISNALSRYHKTCSENDLTVAACVIVSELYRIGVLGIKSSSDDRTRYSHVDSATIPYQAINESTKIHLHPMLHRALNIAPSGRKVR